jgi:hypothetical protein
MIDVIRNLAGSSPRPRTRPQLARRRRAARPGGCCWREAALVPGPRRATLPNGGKMGVETVDFGLPWIPYRYSSTRNDRDRSPAIPMPTWLVELALLLLDGRVVGSRDRSRVFAEQLLCAWWRGAKFPSAVRAAPRQGPFGAERVEGAFEAADLCVAASRREISVAALHSRVAFQACA